jgi:hypothetical protein
MKKGILKGLSIGYDRQATNMLNVEPEVANALYAALE